MLDVVGQNPDAFDVSYVSEARDAPSPARPVRIPCPPHRRLTGFRLIRASEADRASVYALRKAVLKHQVERLTPWDEDKQRARFDEDFRPASLSIIVLANRRVGTVCFRRTDVGYALSMFYVVPDCQGRTLGEAVMGTLLDRARSEDLPVTLTTLNGSRAGAFYERCGFKATGSDRWETSYAWFPPARTSRFARLSRTP